VSNDRVRFELVALNGPLTGARLPLRLGENVVGRDDWVDLPVVAGSVSRRHAVLRLRPGGHVGVTDLASRNGTRVNGVRVTDEAPMTVYDVLEVGEVGLQMVPAGHAATAPAPDGAPTATAARPGVGRPFAGDPPVPGAEHSAPTGLLPRVPADPYSPVPGATATPTRGAGTPPNGLTPAAGAPALPVFPVSRGSAGTGSRAGQRPRPGAAAGTPWPLVLGALAALVALVLLIGGAGDGVAVRLVLVAIVAAGLVTVVRGRRSR
jgi:hypothetical protein